MSWRATQLGNTLCSQDRFIIDLFQGQSVQYIGDDSEFSKHLTCNTAANKLVLIINKPLWLSNILEICKQHLTEDIDYFYLSVNRYMILGNDTNFTGCDIIELIGQVVHDIGFEVLRASKIERDLGRYFNFVQPLTWIYGTKTTN
jgi:hypothetical protein